MFYAIAFFSGDSALHRRAEIHYIVFAAASNGWIGRCVGKIGVDTGLKQQRELEDNSSSSRDSFYSLKPRMVPNNIV